MIRLMQVALAVVLSAVSVRMVQAAPGSASTPGNPRVVVYPSAGQENDSRGSYYISLLKLALARSDGAFDLRPSKQATVTRRALVIMAAGRGIDVVWAPSVPKLDQDFLRVRIPIDHGILGWRIFLIAKGDSESFASVHSLEQLKAYPAGQVTEWADTAILRANGLPVVEATLYESLFPMLAAHRSRYVPRGIGEIEGEARHLAPLGLVIEPHLALHYPSCTHFYVGKHDTELAHQIEIGLRRMQKDGSLEALFQQFNGLAIRRAALDRRTIFELKNPLNAEDGESPTDRCADSIKSIMPRG